MTLGAIYNLIEFICNKDFDGNIITPTRFNELIKVVNIDLFRNKYGLPSGYSPGRVSDFEDMVAKNHDDLKAFKRSLINTPITNGILVFPTDYAHRDTISYNFIKTIDSVDTVLPRPVEIIKETAFASRMGNYTRQPTIQNPIGVVRSDGIHIRPFIIAVVDFFYYRWPVAPEFGYTEGDGYITYNVSSSMEFEWPDDEHLTLAKMILSYIGVNLREIDLVNYAELKLKQS